MSHDIGLRPPDPVSGAQNPKANLEAKAHHYALFVRCGFKLARFQPLSVRVFILYQTARVRLPVV